jgi:hypothetical protein
MDASDTAPDRLCNGLHVERRGRGVAANILAAVVDAAVQQREEGEFDEPTRRYCHGAGVLCGDAELGGIEQANVFDKRPTLDWIM